MILGIGTDIVEVSRIKKMLKNHSDSFLEKIFCDRERDEASLRRNRAEYFAGRWAAKEAISKALNCGIGESCSWLDICTLNRGNGSPETVLSGNAAATAEKIGVKNIHVSITHEKDYACATAVLEK